MTWVHVALAVLVTIIVLVIAVSRSYALGRESGERDTLAGQGSDSGSLFGTDVPVREAEQGLIDVMPSEVIVCDGNGSVRCSSKSQVNVDVIENGWIVKDEILDILHVVVENGGVREREMCVSLDLTRMSSAISGRGVTAGSSAPSDSYLRVRVGHICDGLYAVFINDVTEQRRFERMRRDFVTNVSHELKTPAGAISLLAETVSDAADDPGAVRYFAGRITKESARLTELVTHLIELQRAQDAPAMLKAQRISAMSVVRAAVGENLVQAGAKHIAIRLSLRGEQAPVDADAAADDEAQRDIFMQTPRLQEEAAIGLGATKWEMIKLAVLPFGKSGIVSASMLGLGRALGETMAVLMILSPGLTYSIKLLRASQNQTIAANIAAQYPEADPNIGVPVLIGTGLVLFVITFLVNFVARKITEKASA